jgi:hypothetical protein
MPDKQCDNGHFIDESWDICPYCPPETRAPAPPAKPKPLKPTARPSDIPVVMPRTSSIEPVPGMPSRSAPHRGPRTSSLPKVGAPGAMPRYVVGWLVGLNESARGESQTVRVGRNVIGRDRRSDIVIDDTLASSHHADLVFRPEERRYILMDANSTNGTFVNEAEIQPRHDLQARDVIRIGSTRLLFIPLCDDGFYWEDEGLLK